MKYPRKTRVFVLDNYFKQANTRIETVDRYFIKHTFYNKTSDNGNHCTRLCVPFTENKTDRLHLEPVHDALERFMFKINIFLMPILSQLVIF